MEAEGFETAVQGDSDAFWEGRPRNRIGELCLNDVSMCAPPWVSARELGICASPLWSGRNTETAMASAKLFQ